MIELKCLNDEMDVKIQLKKVLTQYRRISINELARRMQKSAAPIGLYFRSSNGTMRKMFDIMRGLGVRLVIYRGNGTIGNRPHKKETLETSEIAVQRLFRILYDQRVLKNVGREQLSAVMTEEEMSCIYNTLPTTSVQCFMKYLSCLGLKVCIMGDD